MSIVTVTSFFADERNCGKLTSFSDPRAYPSFTIPFGPRCPTSKCSSSSRCWWGFHSSDAILWEVPPLDGSKYVQRCVNRLLNHGLYWGVKNIRGKGLVD